MELIFGEGCDGDMQSIIFGPLADGCLNVTVDGTDYYVHSTSNTNGGEITLGELNPDFEPTGGTVTFRIDDIESLEIH